MRDGRETGRAGPVAAIAALSGAAGLTYEIGWARAFALHFGSEVAVFTGLLAGFLGGLALGAWAGGRWSSRVRNPLLLFALLEVATALTGLCVLPGLHRMTGLLEMLYRRHFESGASFHLPALTLAGLLILPATVLMGATFPALVEHLRRGGRGAGRSAGVLYGANTGGAVVGALVAGLVLLPYLGLTMTLALAAAGNLSAAAIVFLMRPGLGSPAGKVNTEPLPATPVSGLTTGPLLLVAVCLAGVCSMLDQVGWTRVLSMLLGSTVYGFSSILAAFLAGLALGGLAGARVASLGKDLGRSLVLLYAGIGLSSLLGLALLGRLPVWLVPPLARAQAGLGWVLALQFGAAFALVAVPTFLMGTAFPVAVALRAGNTRAAGAAAGQVYAASSAGLVLGSVLAGAWALPALGVHGALLAAALAMPMVALLAGLALPGPRRAAPIGRAAIAAALLPALAWLLPPWDPALLTSGPFLYAPLYRAGAQTREISIIEAIRGRGELAFHDEGAEAIVSVRRSPTGSLSLQINGKTDASTGGDMVSQLLAGHLPALLAPRGAESALMVGLATGVSLGALERYAFRGIDTIELVAQVVEAAPLFRDANGDALRDPRVRLLVGDARNHLRYSRETYDLITSQPTNPWVAGAAALFTRETFRAARDRLRDDGVFCQWVQGYGMRPEDLKSVIATFQEVFPGASLWEESPTGGDYFLVGRKGGPATVDLRLLEERLGSADVRADLERAGVADTAELLSHFVAGPKSLAALTKGVAPQVDDRTWLEFSSALALYEDTLPAVVQALRRYRESPAGWLAGLDQVDDAPALLARLRASRRRARREERFLLSLGAARSEALSNPDLAIGVELLRSGLAGPARRHLERAAGSAAAADARALLGALYASTGDVGRARRELTEAVRLRPSDIASLGLLARLELEAGKLADAARHVSMARDLDADDPDLLNLAGASALLREDTAAALSLLQKAVEHDPELSEAWINLGVARRRSGDAQGAQQAYRRALELAPDNLDARFNLAIGLSLSGDLPAAIRELIAVVTADPADASARLRLADLYQREGRPEESRHQLQQLLRWSPDSPEAVEARETLPALERSLSRPGDAGR